MIAPDNYGYGYGQSGYGQPGFNLPIGRPPGSTGGNVYLLNNGNGYNGFGGYDGGLGFGGWINPSPSFYDQAPAPVPVAPPAPSVPGDANP